MSSSALQSDGSPTEGPAQRESHVKRLSFGIPRPPSVSGHRSEIPTRPGSALDGPSGGSSISRPASRQSTAGIPRPASRTGARTAEPGHYAGIDVHSGGHSTTTTSTSSASGMTPSRSRSSMGGNTYTNTHGPTRGHRPSASVSELRRKANESDPYYVPSTIEVVKRSNTPSVHHSTVSSSTSSSSALPRRQSAGIPRPAMVKRASFNFTSSVGHHQHGGGEAGAGGGGGGRDMLPPPAPPPKKRMSDVGETY